MTGRQEKTLRRNAPSGCAAVALLSFAPVARHGDCRGQVAAAKKWIDNEFQPSVLTKEQQLKEMEWFIKAAEPFKGMTSRWSPKPFRPMPTNRRR